MIKQGEKLENLKYNEMKEIVKKGYDSNKYSDFYRKSKKLNHFEKIYFDTLINNLPQKSIILDLGCGTGIPYDLYLINNGYILITMGVRETDGIEIEDDFCGNIRMAWSHYDYKKNIELINNNGFRILKYDNENDFGSDEHHLWIL